MMFSGMLMDGEIWYSNPLYFIGPSQPGTESWDCKVYYHPKARTATFAGAKNISKYMSIHAADACENILKFVTPYKTDALTLDAAFRGTDPEVERDPPPAPTPVRFPGHVSLPTTLWNEANAPPDLQRLFGSVVRPAHLSREHVVALNINIRPPSKLEDVVPRLEDGTSYIPSAELDENRPSPTYIAPARQDSVVQQREKDLWDRLIELRSDNDTAFRAVTKTTKEGTRPPRLAYLRKFWEGLENMSQYWDCSLDEYFTTLEPEPNPPDGFDKDPYQKKKIRLDSLPAIPVTRNPPNSPTPEIDPEHDANIWSAGPAGTKLEVTPPMIQEESVPITALRYKGRRTSTGRDMPPAFLTTLVTAFAEAALWPFNCRVMPPRRMPVIQLGRLNIPVRLSAGVYRLPPDRQTQRLGWVEGPLMGILCRHETEFEPHTEAKWSLRGGTDLLRELSALLEIAQERRRAKQVDKRPGKGQWWTEKPRWGGGPGGEVGSEEGIANENHAIVTSTNEETKSLKTYKRAPAKRKTPAELWKELRCGSSVWDPKATYEAVGREPGTAWDEIFLISSLNHHVSILKLTVHDEYMEYLATGTMPSPAPEDKEWCRPRLVRSEWFDFFDREKRVQAFLAIWRIMAYLTRNT